MEAIIRKRPRQWLLFAIALVAALAVRWSVRDFVTGDVKYWVSYWYGYLNEHGLAAFRTELPNDDGWQELRGSYPPTYYYLLWIATFFDRFVPSLYLIKAVSVCFDFLAAWFVFKIASLQPDASNWRPWVGFFVVLLAPTLILDGAFWGQCDAIHTSLLLGAIYFSLVRRPLWVIVFFGMAFSFKAQSIFLFPYLLVLARRSILPWAYLLLIPIVYVTMMLPAVFLGRPLIDTLTVYLHQGDFLRGLSLNAANLYYFVNDGHYLTGVYVGIVITISASLLFVWRAGTTRKPSTHEFLLTCAAFSVAMSPFLLPKMHDRYFLAADLTTIALALYVPRLWYLPVGFQTASLLAYIPVVSDTVTNFGGEITAQMPLAVLLNTALMIAFTRELVTTTRDHSSFVDTAANPQSISRPSPSPTEPSGSSA